MLINIGNKYEKALRTGWATKVARNDPGLTYQEFIYVWALRQAASRDDEVDPKEFCMYKAPYLECYWLEYPYHEGKPKVFNQDWATIFDQKQDKYAKEYEDLLKRAGDFEEDNH